MLTQLLTDMRQQFHDPHVVLPSPAIVGESRASYRSLTITRTESIPIPFIILSFSETAARLACMSENEKNVGSIFARVVEDAAKEGGFRSTNFLFIIIELMTFRCFNQLSSRSNVIIAAFQLLYHARPDNVSDPQTKVEERKESV